MQTQADMGIGPVSCENCSVFKKGEGGPEAPGALRLRNKKATASVASSYSQNPPVCRKGRGHGVSRVPSSESVRTSNVFESVIKFADKKLSVEILELFYSRVRL